MVLGKGKGAPFYVLGGELGARACSESSSYSSGLLHLLNGDAKARGG